MNISARQWLLRAAVVVAMLISFVEPAGPAAAAVYGPISGGGSTMSYNAFHSWIGFVAQYGMRVDYERSGSTAGRAKFAQGVLDWAASDFPYGVEGDPPPARGFTYMPDTAVATTFMYNLKIGTKRVTNLRLSGENIAKIFTGALTRWNDPAIAADNPGLSLPAIAIVPVVRSDGNGSSLQFTRWMAARHGQYWTDYCAAVGRQPCAPTSAYPNLPNSAMISQPGDLGVSGYVSQEGAVGAIGYVENTYAVQAGFPVAKVLNSAGYYTAPTAGHVGVSLLKTKIDANGIQDLSDVYTNPDPRTYELSWASYMILPTDTSLGFTTDDGFTLGAFGAYLLCTGQGQVNQLGYAALPAPLVEAAYPQLQKVPGAQLTQSTSDFLKGCGHVNPAMSPDGTDALAASDPMPQQCDRQGQTQCLAAASTIALTGPTRVAFGDVVTLTATVAPADATGRVQFTWADNTPLGSPVTVAKGTAQIETIPPIGTNTIFARFLPADPSVFVPSTSSPFTIEVLHSIGESVDVNVPLSEGVLTMTVDGTPVVMDTAALRNDHTFESTGTLGAVTISDGRDQTHPGWSVSGQIGDFTGGGHTFNGAYLGWTPTVVGQNAGHDAVAGAAVLPGADPGLKSGVELGHAAATGGLGTTVLGADLLLKIPSSTQPGTYVATLTITALATA